MNCAKEIEKSLSKIVGVPVDVTIRGVRDFTFSTDIVDNDLEFKLVKFFGSKMQISLDTQIDNETGTFVYMRASA
jgi:copper chaperone CopZ